MKKVGSTLICTNHLFMWAGSELVAIELAEELLKRGVDVALFATVADRDFLRGVFGDSVTIHDRVEEVDLARHDLVYAQHHVFPLILHATWAHGRELDAGPVLVWNHLSSFSQLEMPGPCVESTLADVILANSPETKATLATHGPPFNAARVWPNPAPAEFGAPLPPPDAPGFLAVSNHVVGELDQAFALLEREGIPVRNIGQQHAHERVRPAHLAPAQGVITIGKTVQYALRAGRPVYCYGPHGGPGWLTAETYAAAGTANFSGRSHPGKKTGDGIALELVAGLSEAVAFARSLDPAADGFCLEIHVKSLLEEAGAMLGDPVWRARRRTVLANSKTRRAVALEANMADAIRRFYLKSRSADAGAVRVA